MNRHFPKEDIQIANNQMKRCLTSLVIMQEMQIKTTTRYHITPIRMAIFLITNVGKDMEKLNPSALMVGMLNGAAAVGNSLVVLNTELP